MENYTVKYTHKKKNPYFAVSEDGLNEAYGQTKEEAIENLKQAINKRTNG